MTSANAIQTALAVAFAVAQFTLPSQARIALGVLGFFLAVVGVTLAVSNAGTSLLWFAGLLTPLWLSVFWDSAKSILISRTQTIASRNHTELLQAEMMTFSAGKEASRAKRARIEIPRIQRETLRNIDKGLQLWQGTLAANPSNSNARAMIAILEKQRYETEMQLAHGDSELAERQAEAEELHRWAQQDKRPLRAKYTLSSLAGSCASAAVLLLAIGGVCVELLAATSGSAGVKTLALIPSIATMVLVILLLPSIREQHRFFAAICVAAVAIPVLASAIGGAGTRPPLNGLPLASALIYAIVR